MIIEINNTWSSSRDGIAMAFFPVLNTATRQVLFVNEYVNQIAMLNVHIKRAFRIWNQIVFILTDEN